ncbi:hypothetical protein TRFO_00986 [Tritrichomonas foetus]|uniref:MORN repeat-containing protein 1 n=1 Tax=Tritrichomonas foetus TaxID=1144522 RepID=A0A1J4L2Q7_9EUKA|nr:hypothetical protein TRFO_00986 [Tritrichomonas foetus]|eukprot:OHT17682.1 hypothetical protein TRFO_00986 [Tritrichomonas foetus]
MSDAPKLPCHGPRCNFVFPPTKDGEAIYEYQNTYFTYTGEWKNGKKDGNGRFQIGPNSYYEGEFKDGEITGIGARYFENGNHYFGDFVKGEFNGRGSFIDEVNGEEYEGEWKDNRRHGEGKLTYSDGSQYVGHFLNHKRNGQGEYKDIEGNQYTGEWKNNMIEGEGQMTFSNDDVYIGEFKNGQRHGWGTMKWADTGISFTGEWVDDECEYQPSEIVIPNMPPIIPGATLNNTKIFIEGGKGETGRVLRASIEVGQSHAGGTSKSKTKLKKTENISLEPKLLVVNPLTNQTYIDLVVNNGMAILQDVIIPPDAEQTTYTLHVVDQSEIDPLPPVSATFTWMTSVERSHMKTRRAKKGTSQSDRRTSQRGA